ncbi:hypothetical protein, partial [Yersinia aldovae]|uniref:hypothetical protein n=1 Tax=Yersinia aldovae TaxID=29483 RepID=UPI001C96134F
MTFIFAITIIQNWDKALTPLLVGKYSAHFSLLTTVFTVKKRVICIDTTQVSRLPLIFFFHLLRL